MKIYVCLEHRPYMCHEIECGFLNEFEADDWVAENPQQRKHEVIDIDTEGKEMQFYL